MPISKNQLLRYKVIDEALRESFNMGKNGLTRKELMWRVANAMHGETGAEIKDNKGEFQRYEKGVSRRTFYEDINYLKSIGAPIETDKFGDGGHYFFYMTHFAFGESVGKDELARLYRARAALAQLGLSGLSDQLEEIIQMVKDKLKYVEMPQGLPLQLEDRELKGLEHLTPLLETILLPEQPDLLVSYNPYKAPPLKVSCRPVFLKEFNRRWYLIALEHKTQRVLNLALDRIEGFKQTKFAGMPKVNLEKLAKRYEQVIGVTILEDAPHPQKVLLRLSPSRAPYVLTKPLHKSQQKLEENQEGITIGLKVILNKELEARILELGCDVEVLAPRELREKIGEILKKAYEINTKY